MQIHPSLFSGKTYHLFSRAVGAEKLFREPANYYFFLERLKKYVSPIADIHAYCLLPNHFHLLARFRCQQLLEEHYQFLKPGRNLNEDHQSRFLMQCFSNMLNSYSKSFNKWYKRKGALFIDYIKRVEIESMAQLWQAVFYIHKNPVHHGYCPSLAQWPWSSFRSYAEEKEDWLQKEEIWQCYGSRKIFMQYHEQPVMKRSLRLE